jgi:serine/threonine protein kinase
MIGYCIEVDMNCIVTELIKGGNLMNWLQDKKKEISENQKIEWSIQATMAVNYLHHNDVIHRDIKSNNFLVTII